MTGLYGVLLFNRINDQTLLFILSVSTGTVIGLIVLATLLVFLWRSRRRLRENHLELRDREARLRLILDSTAEGIYGIDLEGRCTFSNASCLRILGFAHESELVGETMHLKIHHTDCNHQLIPAAECKIYRAVSDQKEIHVEDEKLYRADGSSFPASIRAYPQFEDGKPVGAVISFTDITDKKQLDEKIRYLGLHDSLTGLYNRNFFNAELKRLDTKRNLPIALIIGDVNGLKLTNDIFGHFAGDQLLESIANVLRDVCRADDIIARTGGDEFAILMPHTNHLDADRIIERIRGELAQRRFAVAGGSIALGCSIKSRLDQDLKDVMAEAEEVMYLDKIIHKGKYSRTVIDSMIQTLHDRSSREKQHSEAVSTLCRTTAESLALPSETVRKIADAGFLHDIGKVTLSNSQTLSRDNLDLVSRHVRDQHVVNGYRILNSFEDTMDLAEIALSHHERWDGTGYPKGLSGEDIPLGARIIALAEQYDYLTNPFHDSNARTRQEALQIIRQKAGSKFDPLITDVFVAVLEQDQTSDIV